MYLITSRTKTKPKWKPTNPPKPKQSAWYLLPIQTNSMGLLDLISFPPAVTLIYGLCCWYSFYDDRKSKCSKSDFEYFFYNTHSTSFPQSLMLLSMHSKLRNKLFMWMLFCSRQYSFNSMTQNDWKSPNLSGFFPLHGSVGGETGLCSHTHQVRGLRSSQIQGQPGEAPVRGQFGREAPARPGRHVPHTRLSGDGGVVQPTQQTQSSLWGSIYLWGKN